MSGMLDSLFRSEKTYKADIQFKASNFSDGVHGPISWEVQKTVDCLIWRGGASDRTVGEKLRAEIEAVALFRPSDVSESDFEDDARINISSLGLFSVVKSINIAGQDAVIQVYLKEVK